MAIIAMMTTTSSKEYAVFDVVLFIVENASDYRII